MRLVRDWPFSGMHLQLSERERAALLRAAEIAERAATYCPPDSAAWEEWKGLEVRARDAAGQG